MSRPTVLGITILLALTAAAAVATGKDKGVGTMEKATFAGGCFWCMEAPFDTLPGVVSVTVGYAGGTVENPTYEQVSAGRTGHAEAVQIVVAPSKTGYGKLLGIFWRNVDPTVEARAVCAR